MVKLDAAVFGRGGVQRPGVGGVGADGRLVNQVKHPLGAGRAFCSSVITLEMSLKGLVYWLA